jgi:hypothetical protein
LGQQSVFGSIQSGRSCVFWPVAFCAFCRFASSCSVLMVSLMSPRLCNVHRTA